MKLTCQHKHYLSKRICGRPAKWVIRASYDELLVCGIHRRGWTREASYPIGKAQAATPADRRKASA